MSVPPLTADVLVVFAVVAAALVLFVTERLPTDTTAIGVIVALVVLGRWTHVTPAGALSGFSSPATITIVGMYVLSEAVQETGVVERLGAVLGRLTDGSEGRMLGATVGTTGLAAAVVNNTPVVAVFIPMITELASDNGISPSKLLLPLSYAAMLGGTLTLVGTSTNLLASSTAGKLAVEYPGLGLHEFSMFEFTPLGVVVLLVGAAYLLTVGRRLTPARVTPGADLTETYAVQKHLSVVGVREASPLVGERVGDLDDVVGEDFDLDVVQIARDGETVAAPGAELTVQPGDDLTVRASLQAVNRFAEAFDLRQRTRQAVTDEDLATGGGARLAEVLVPYGSRFVGKTVAETYLGEYHRATVIAVRRGETIVREGLSTYEIGTGDTLLVQTTEEDLEYLVAEDDLVRTHHLDTSLLAAATDAVEPSALDPRTPIVLGTVAAVIAVAALGLLPIEIAALGGVVALVATDCLRPGEAYDAVNWEVIFLLAGVIPLGIALRETGGAAFLAGLLVQSAAVLPAIGVLALFYVVTGLLANLITPVASVVLMLPVAVDTAARIDARAFSFVLAVTFAANTAFMTPVGYQTNLMVYAPGGYRFTDYVRVGAPLQALLAVVTTVGIVTLWGI